MYRRDRVGRAGANEGPVQVYTSLIWGRSQENFVVLIGASYLDAPKNVQFQCIANKKTQSKFYKNYCNI